MAKRRIQYDPKHDYYRLLGVEPRASAEEITAQYRQKAKTLHPDMNPERAAWATEQFQRLNEAYKILKDPTSRRTYDELRWAQLPHRAGTHNHRSSTAKPSYTPGATTRRPSTTAPRPQTRPNRYEPIRRAPTRRRGLWMEKYGLGVLRPVYTTIADLMDSPYRFLLIFVMIVLFINFTFLIALIATSSNSSAERVEAVATATLRTFEGPELSLSPICRLNVAINSLEQGRGGHIDAFGSMPTNSETLRIELVRVNLLDADQPRPLVQMAGDWLSVDWMDTGMPAERAVQVVSGQRITFDNALITNTLRQDLYLVRFTDRSTGGIECDVLITLIGD